MANSELEYSYEYQGTGAKLVWTPLTEKCFLTLTQAIKMGLGGNPFGPAGTGKTESIKALGGLLGRQVLVFNCDKGIDVKSMGRIFVGLVKCGAWGCFDEFNRLEEATLSAVSMIIQPIQVALQENKKTVNILGEEVSINRNCGLFVTLNPAGKKYGGRKKLPNNLKQLFRPVVMSVPDEKLIAQVSLFCEGFKDAKLIGGKLVEVFDLAKNLLSKQQHYDWGLRALKTILGSCGNLFKENRKRKSNDRFTEMELSVEAIRLNTLSKLTFKDSSLLDNIIKDVFTEVKFIGSDFDKLKNALHSSCEELGLQLNKDQIQKCIELYEQMQQRMGVALVGPSGTGKSTILKLLKAALEKLHQTVKYYVVNPKSMPRTQFFGQVDVDTRQWKEGVLTTIALKIHSENSDVLSWLICDGDIDPDWVEALNSVLDDNRLLTLPSGWRIQFGPNVNFLFETSDLNHASPATVSRMGIIFLSDQMIDTKIIVSSWLSSQTEECRLFVEPYISDYFFKCVEWIKGNEGSMVPHSVVALVKSGLSHLDNVKSRSQFVIALIYGLGANLTEETKERFAKNVFDLMEEYIPDPSRILDSYYNTNRQRIDVLPFDDNNNDINEDFGLVLTPAARTSSYVLDPWINSLEPILVCGAEGSGKTLLVNYCLSKIPSVEIATIFCSALISPQHVIQKLRQVCMVTTVSTGRVFKPKNSQKLVIFFKNLELAVPDVWGTNVLITWLQQVVTCQGFYDDDLEWTRLEKIQIIGTLNDGPHFPTTRFTSISRIFCVSSPTITDLKAIYSVHIRSIIFKSFDHHKAWTVDSKISSLVATLVSIFEKVSSNFTKMIQKHYLFSPRDLSRWCAEIRRYKVDLNNPIKNLLEVVVFVGFRLFYDRLVDDHDKTIFKEAVRRVVEDEWNHGDIVENIDNVFFEPNESRTILSKINRSDWSDIVNKGITISLGEENDVLIVDELLRLVSSIAVNLSAPNSSLILAGRSGVGRKTAVRIVASLYSSRLITLNLSHTYSIKTFKIDLKSALQYAGVEGESVFLLLEDYQIIDNVFLDMLNSLLSSGEVPELYNADELESVILSLRDIYAAEAYSGSIASFFASRVRQNLHVILIIDLDKKLKALGDYYSRLFSKCTVIWLPEWSSSSMKLIPKMILSSLVESNEIDQEESLYEICKSFYDFHKEFKDATPRRFMTFIKTYFKIYLQKRKSITERAEGLKAGVTKLNQTKTFVDNLKKEAAKQKEKMAEKQLKASSALNLIGETMRNANTHKEKMEELRKQAVLESQELTERKKAIDKELSEVNPLIEEARQAVGNIKNESLSEIRSLRAPPDAIRDILEGVLCLMGIQDTSWNNMKIFLAKRGVKEEIRTFDVHRISPESKDAVNLLLAERRDSFDPKVAKRASVAAAPLAAWVKANIKYAMVLDKIRPLEKEQKRLELTLSNIEDQVGSISTGLGEVDEKVNELKNQLNTYTKEAAVIEIDLTKAQETVASAQELITKLEDEYKRWTSQLKELTDGINRLPQNVLLGAAFITYLSASSEDKRRAKLEEWQSETKNGRFSVVDFLATERDKLKWVSEGLSSDELSFENAVIMLESRLHPLIIDPNGMATNWLKNHFANKNLEIISQHSPKLQTTVEFAVRFGKTLIVEDTDDIHPVLVPILRKDIVNQGTRQIIYVGEKPVDYNKDFKMFLVTRNTNVQPRPDATAISFTVTEKGLAGQLLTLAVDQGKPELGSRRNELLKKEEEMKLKLYNIQENLLQQLGSAQGDILGNKELINSLNQTKMSSEDVFKSLEESKKLELQLEKEYQSYSPIAEFGSRLYFTIVSLSYINNIYQFSINSFKKVFQKSLKADFVESENYIDIQEKNLVRDVYYHVSRSLFNSDRLAFAFRLFSNMFKESLILEEWKAFKGEVVSDTQNDSQFTESLPKWIEEDRYFDINVLKNALPILYSQFTMSEINEWLKFSKSQECEKEVPKSLMSKLSSFQVLLIIQAFRPDRLYSSMTNFVLNKLGIKTLSPPTIRLSEVAQESVNNEPILLILSPGVDPSEELRSLARTLPYTDLHEIAIGEGQTQVAMELLKSCSESGQWLCIKNLHLMTSWLGELEKEFRSLKLHSNFRLWLTTEPNEEFSPVLANSCLKITYECPPGIKKNLQRTFASWSSDMFRRKGVLFGRTLFAAALFHAVVQERRIFIPQGWSKFYEFNDSDLRAAVDLISKIFGEAPSSINWTFIHGLLLDAIYGGRIDNDFDIEILKDYLQEYFNEASLSKGVNFGPNLSLPTSESYSEYLQLIHQLSDFDKPYFFGLPENIERSWQKIKSSEAIEKLKVMEHSTKTVTSDTMNWQQTLNPILNLWKKLNQKAGLIEFKLTNRKLDKIQEDPVLEFIRKDFEYGLRVVQFVHQTLAAINKIIRSLMVADDSVLVAAKSLMNHQTPLRWQNVWEGSENPMKYLSAIVNKALKLQKLIENPSSDDILEEDVDLTIFFQPEKFLKAFKQLSSRKLKIPTDHMDLYSKWVKSEKISSVSVRLKNLQVEGASFDGHVFKHTTIESPIFITAPPVVISYIPKDSLEFQRNKDKVIFPVYRSSKRETLLMALTVPCEGDKERWHKAGAAFFLRE